MYTCRKCGKNYENRHRFLGHCSSHNRKKKENKLKEPKIHSCRFCSKIFETGPKLGSHVRLCHLNPNYKKTKNKISKAQKGKALSEEHKAKVSKSMKLAHKEGRAWNIGKSRWNNQPSWPEKFFMQVIETEFEDKNYVREYPINKYSIDFAWIDKKLAIEIDGSQHDRFKEYKLRDLQKNKILYENGWKVLRIKWKDLYSNTKTFIQLAKEFIHN